MENQTSLKLTGDNWVVWKFQTKVFLKSRQYYDIVIGVSIRPTTPGDEQKKWDKNDAKAQELIVSRMEQGPLTHILSCESSKDMWSKLKSVYDKESEVSIHLLQQKFFLLQFESGSSVSSFISNLEEIQSKLKQAGEELSGKMIITKILMALPDEYKHFRSAWESVPSDKQTLDELTSRLLIEEERNKSSESSTAYLATKNHHQKNKLKCHVCKKVGHLSKQCFFRKKEKLNTHKEMKYCTSCKRKGHIIQECWFLKNKNSRKENNLRKEDAGSSSDTNAFMVYSENEEKNGMWCLDTGATEHMCNDKKLFESMTQTHINRQVKLGNGEKVPIRGKGEVIVWAYNGKKMMKSTLSNVLYVPELKFNLFSAGCALDKGYTMYSDNEKCEFLNRNGEVRAIATRKNKLYKMHFSKENNPESFANVVDEESTLENEGEKFDFCFSELLSSECNSAKTIEALSNWHCKLAHQNVSYIKQFLRKNNIDFLDEKIVCEQCLSGKQHRLPFYESESRATEPLELVHTDICGPMEEESLGGARYFLLLKDDFTNYRYIYFLKNKFEVKKHLENFISLAERETGYKVKVLRSDNGLEFVNKEIKELMETRGIRHQRSVVYTPQQNGRAERENRTLVEAARTMIQGQKLIKNLWAEAINTATFVLNRTGVSSKKNITPYELWHKKQVNPNMFKNFGSKVSVYIPKEKRLKWDAKNMFGIFLGYSEDVKGYRIYIPEKNKVEILRDIIFLPDKTIDFQKKGEENKKSIDQEKPNKYSEINIQSDTKESTDNDQECQQSEVEMQAESSDSRDSAENEEQEENFEERRYNLRRETKLPSRFNDYVMTDEEFSLITQMDEEEPQTYEEAMKSNEWRKWQVAVEAERNALEENNTWEYVSDESIGQNKIIECKWVFKRKRNDKGNVVKFKARLVVKGFQQRGMSFADIYSPVAKLPSIRVFLALCNNFGLTVHQLDVCSAFLNGDIKDDVYISLPKGFQEIEGKVCKLRKSLYGLKTSPKNWNDKFHDLMTKMLFKRSEYEYCLYVKINDRNKTYILIYVDDVILAGTDENDVQNVIKKLNNNFKMNNLGQIRYFLGMNIKQNITDKTTMINQTSYLKKVLKKFGLSNCKPSKTPMESNFHHEYLKRENSESDEIEKTCRKAIGSLMYAMLCSRPDICNAVSILSRYQTCASYDLWKEIKKVLRYIQGTIHFSLIYHKMKCENLIVGYSDSDWAGDRTDRKSTSGYVFKVFDCTVSWASRKQSTVSLSSTEAEYVALSQCVSEACWLRYLVNDLKISRDPVRVLILADNQSAIKVCKNPEYHKRLKHVDIRFHFIRQTIKENIVVLKYISTYEQQADLFTKPLGFTQFQKLREKLGLHEDNY